MSVPRGQSAREGIENVPRSSSPANGRLSISQLCNPSTDEEMIHDARITDDDDSDAVEPENDERTGNRTCSDGSPVRVIASATSAVWHLSQPRIPEEPNHASHDVDLDISCKGKIGSPNYTRLPTAPSPTSADPDAAQPDVFDLRRPETWHFLLTYLREGGCITGTTATICDPETNTDLDGKIERSIEELHEIRGEVPVKTVRWVRPPRVPEVEIEIYKHAQRYALELDAPVEVDVAVSRKRKPAAAVAVASRKDAGTVLDSDNSKKRKVATTTVETADNKKRKLVTSTAKVTAIATAGSSSGKKRKRDLTAMDFGAEGAAEPPVASRTGYPASYTGVYGPTATVEPLAEIEGYDYSGLTCGYVRQPVKSVEPAAAAAVDGLDDVIVDTTAGYPTPSPTKSPVRTWVTVESAERETTREVRMMAFKDAVANEREKVKVMKGAKGLAGSGMGGVRGMEKMNVITAEEYNKSWGVKDTPSTPCKRPPPLRKLQTAKPQMVAPAEMANGEGKGEEGTMTRTGRVVRKVVKFGCD
ncbi:MAG: hypothetical protein Q9166_005341 [cf. Caloplaca sp. 2 TL-2023]